MRKYSVRWTGETDPVVEMDSVCFPSDVRVAPEGSLWWVARHRRAGVVGYAGLRICQMPYNRGLGFLCRAGVLQAHRGRGLQRQMIAVREAYARRMGLRELVTYVVPTNFASANSLIACGFRLYRPSHRWGGVEALYFRKKVTGKR
jgi:GNAT superfamily N-acetyltransferase